MPDVTATLQKILADHGVETQINSDGWLTSAVPYPSCRAFTDEPHFRDGICRLRMDVEVALSPHRVIVESFSDFGTDANQAFRSSLQSFCAGSLHVLLSGLWGVTDDSQVLVESHTIDGKPWTLHLGNIVRKAAGGADVPPPIDLMPTFDQLIRKLPLDPCVHWGRLYYANMPKMENIIEVLIDNQPSSEAQQQFNASSWAKTDFFYSQRMFWVLMPGRAS